MLQVGVGILIEKPWRDWSLQQESAAYGGGCNHPSGLIMVPRKKVGGRAAERTSRPTPGGAASSGTSEAPGPEALGKGTFSLGLAMEWTSSG